eukprot:1422042-Amphidinium_carterae.1
MIACTWRVYVQGPRAANLTGSNTVVPNKRLGLVVPSEAAPQHVPVETAAILSKRWPGSAQEVKTVLWCHVGTARGA